MLTKNQRRVCEAYVENPFARHVDIAEIVGVTRETVTHILNSAECKEYIDMLCKESFKKTGQKAMKMMDALVTRGNEKACEFVLRANGINPIEKVEVATNDIHITIDDDKPAST